MSCHCFGPPSRTCPEHGEHRKVGMHPALGAPYKFVYADQVDFDVQVDVHDSVTFEIPDGYAVDLDAFNKAVKGIP